MCACPCTRFKDRKREKTCQKSSPGFFETIEALAAIANWGDWLRESGGVIETTFTEIDAGGNSARGLRAGMKVIEPSNHYSKLEIELRLRSNNICPKMSGSGAHC